MTIRKKQKQKTRSHKNIFIVTGKKIVPIILKRRKKEIECFKSCPSLPIPHSHGWIVSTVFMMKLSLLLFACCVAALQGKNEA